MKSHLALVTGASRGIGAAVAETLGSRGVGVLCAARREASSGGTVERIRAAGGQAWALALDVSDSDSVTAAVSRARSEFADGAPIDWLVNNAGVAISSPLLKPSAEGIDDLWHHHMEINFHGARRLVEALAPDMIERGYGRVVNIASSAGLRGYAYVAAYVASKHALLGYTRSAAQELAKKNIGVHAICPHYVDSPMTDVSIERIAQKTGQSLEEARAFFAGQNPSGQLVSPAQIAECAFDLLDAENSTAAFWNSMGATSLTRFTETPSFETSLPAILSKEASATLHTMTEDDKTHLLRIDPREWKKPKGYANAVLVPANRDLLFVAGQIGWDADEKVLGLSEPNLTTRLALQFEKALENVCAVLEEAGTEASQICRMTVYVTDKQRYLACLKEIGAAWKRLIGRNYPAMSLVQVADLLEKGALVEIEVTAAMPPQ